MFAFSVEVKDNGLGTAFGGALGPFRLYFLLLLPIAVAAAIACLRLRTKVYSYRPAKKAIRRRIRG